MSLACRGNTNIIRIVKDGKLKDIEAESKKRRNAPKGKKRLNHKNKNEVGRKRQRYTPSEKLWRQELMF